MRKLNTVFVIFQKFYYRNNFWKHASFEFYQFVPFSFDPENYPLFKIFILLYLLSEKDKRCPRHLRLSHHFEFS
jgi:hypothetical protein